MACNTGGHDSTAHTADHLTDMLSHKWADVVHTSDVQLRYRKQKAGGGDDWGVLQEAGKEIPPRQEPPGAGQIHGSAEGI